MFEDCRDLWKDNTYSEHLRALLDDKSFRDTLLRYTLATDTRSVDAEETNASALVIQQQHRAELMHVLLLYVLLDSYKMMMINFSILYGRMRARVAGAGGDKATKHATRQQVLRFIGSQCNGMFIGVVEDNHSIFYSCGVAVLRCDDGRADCALHEI
jgi:hypothetical protein